VFGQFIFAAYVAVFYGSASLAGDFERWNKVLPRGYDPADPLGNAMLGLHLLLAVALVIAGALQLIPSVRRYAPAVHRWNGRAYMTFASVLAIGGLWLVWVRGGAAGDVSQHVAISINAALIIGCAGLAWRAARARRFAEHKRWALSLFLVASGVWFFRVGLMAWVAIHRRPVGFDPATFSGPFLTSLAIGVYVVLPLALVQAYFAAAQRGSTVVRFGVAGLLGLVALVILGGTLAATMGMWLPRMR
jgi:hypothetical protein